MTRKSDDDRIKPVFFPFTYLPEPVSERIFSLLGRSIVYQPGKGSTPDNMHRLSQSGRIEIRMPVKEASDRLAKLSKAFSNWGMLHQGQGRVFKERSDVGFYNREFAAQIRSEILKDSKGTAIEKDPLFSARLFLLLSQDYDIKQDEINQQLAESTADHLNLFSGLKGEPETQKHSMNHLPTDDTGGYMTGSRILAWLRLMQADEDKSPVLVTTSIPCFNQLIEFAGPEAAVCMFEGEPCSPTDGLQKDLMAGLIELAKSRWSGEGHGERDPSGKPGVWRFFLRLYILPGISPDMLVDRCLLESDRKQRINGRYLNSLIGLVKV